MQNDSVPEDVKARRYLRWCVLLAVIPIAYCCGLTILYGYDIPYWDQWRKVPLVIKAFEGTLTLGDCWALNNEHRVFFPNLLMIPVALVTQWTIGYELILTILFMLTAYGYIIRVMLRDASNAVRQHLYLLIPVFSLLMFSFSQRAIWVWGLRTMIPMALLAMLIAIRHLIADEMRARDFAIAVACSFFASYTFGTGIVLWGVGFVVFIVRIYRRQSKSLGWLALWCASAAVCMWIYFWGYASIGTESTAQSVLTHPVAYAGYILGYIGGPLVPYHGTGGFMESYHAPIAVLTGVLGIALGVHALRLAARNEQYNTLGIRFACALLVLAIGCAMLTGLKQWPEGPSQAASSRYLTWSTMYWVGVLMLHASAGESFRLRKPVLVSLLLLVTLGNGYGSYKADERYSAFESGKASLIAGRDDTNILWIYPTSDIPLTYRGDLIKHRLTVFRYRQIEE